MVKEKIVLNLEKEGECLTFYGDPDFNAPALDFQWFLSEAAKSAIRNGGNWKDMPLLEAGHLMWLSRDQQRVGGLPYFMQDILFGAISLLVLLTGRAKNIAPKPR